MLRFSVYCDKCGEELVWSKGYRDWDQIKRALDTCSLECPHCSRQREALDNDVPMTGDPDSAVMDIARVIAEWEGGA